jgi:hypothetical protein
MMNASTANNNPAPNLLEQSPGNSPGGPLGCGPENHNNMNQAANNNSMNQFGMKNSANGPANNNMNNNMNQFGSPPNGNGPSFGPGSGPGFGPGLGPGPGFQTLLPANPNMQANNYPTPAEDNLAPQRLPSLKFSSVSSDDSLPLGCDHKEYSKIKNERSDKIVNTLRNMHNET